MKKFTIILLVITLALSLFVLTGCNNEPAKTILYTGDWTSTVNIDVDGHDLGYVVPKEEQLDHTKSLNSNVDNCPSAASIMSGEYSTITAKAATDDSVYPNDGDDVYLFGTYFSCPEKTYVDDTIAFAKEIKNTINSSTLELNKWYNNNGEINYGYNVESKYMTCYDEEKDIASIYFVSPNSYYHIVSTYDDNENEVITINHYDQGINKVYIVYIENVCWTCLHEHINSTDYYDVLGNYSTYNIIDCDLSKPNTPVTDITYHYMDGFKETEDGYTIDYAELDLYIFDEYPIRITDIGTGFNGCGGGGIRDDILEGYNHDDFPTFSKCQIYNNDETNNIMLICTGQNHNIAMETYQNLSDDAYYVYINPRLLDGWVKYDSGALYLKNTTLYHQGENSKYYINDKTYCSLATSDDVFKFTADFLGLYFLDKCPTYQDVVDALQQLELTVKVDFSEALSFAKPDNILDNWTAFGKTGFSDLRVYMIKSMRNSFNEYADSIESINTIISEAY